MNTEKIKIYQWFVNQRNVKSEYLKHIPAVMNYLYKEYPNIKQLTSKKNEYSINEYVSLFNDNLKLYDIYNDLNLEFLNNNTKFSWSENNFISTGHKMNVGSIKDLISYSCIYDSPLYIKMSDCPYRMDNVNFCTAFWNNCVAIDIDYKKCYDIYKIDPNVIYNDIVSYLKTNYSNIFLYSEMSRSGKGYHFIFNINSPRTLDGIKFAVIMSEVIITDAFINNKYGDIIYYPEVLDDCTRSIIQGIFFTGNNYVINNECNGDYKEYYENLKTVIINKLSNIKYNNLKDLLQSKNTPELEFINNLSYDDLYENINNTVIYKHINRKYRWECFTELYSLLIKANIFTEENLRNLWELLMSKMPIGKHDTKHYYNEPYKQDWNEKKSINKLKYPNALKALGILKNINI